MLTQPETKSVRSRALGRMPVPEPHRDSLPWWRNFRAPKAETTLRIGKNVHAWGGDRFVLHLGQADGEEIARRGFDRFRLASVDGRIVTITLHKLTEEGRRWGLHSIRLTRINPPAIYLPLRDLPEPLPYTLVEHVAYGHPIKLRFGRAKLTFRLPRAIR